MRLDDPTSLQKLSACLRSHNVGDLVLLIDTSGSLKNSDPTAVRVAAAQALVTRFAATLAEMNAQVDVSVAGFDDDISTIMDFTPLTPDAVPTINSQLQTFEDRNKGGETDYWSALTWLNKTLQAKAQARGGDLGNSCQFAIWLTDGAFEISARTGSTPDGEDPLNSETKDIPGYEGVPLTDETTADAARDAAKVELCRPQGPADQLRAAGVTLIGVGLGEGAADAPEFAFLRDYVTNPSGTCGALPGSGLFVPASDVGDLFLLIDKITDFDDQTPRPPPAPVCQDVPCPAGTYSFTLDNTLSKVHIAAVVKESGSLLRTGIQVVIAPPGSPSTVIDGSGSDAGSATTSSAAVAYRWYPGYPLTIDLTRTQDWSGEWKVTFVDTSREHPDAVSNINLSLTSDFKIKPVLAPGTPWRAGLDSGPIEFRPQTADGQNTPVDALPDSFEATATVQFPGADGEIKGIDVSLTQPVTIPIPEDIDPGLATVTVVLKGQIAGRPLADVQDQVSVQILPPFGAPGVAPPNQIIDFGSIEGLASPQATLTVIGPEVGDGCVTVATGNLIVTPPKVQSVTITGPNSGSCVTVPEKETVQLTLSLTPGQEGNGHLEGDLDVGLAPASDPEKVSQVPVRYVAEMQRMPQSTVRTGILIGAMSLGLLLALALIWLARLWSARFPRGDGVALQSVAVDVKVSSAALTLANGAPLAPPSDGWVPVLQPGAGRRSLTVSGVLLRARAGWRLTEPGYAALESGDQVGACGLAPYTDKQGRPRLPLSVQGTWTVFISRMTALSPMEEVPGRLLLVVDTAAEGAIREHLVASAARDAPTLVDAARLRARAADKTGHQEPPQPSEQATSYPAYGQPDPVGAAGGQPAGWGQPAGAPDWGRHTGPAPGWGAPAGPGSSWDGPPPMADRPPPGGQSPQPGGWGDPPPPGGAAPERPRGGDGW
ncbi:MAG: VWA domain-containing protein [Nakamurella sp.]